MKQTWKIRGQVYTIEQLRELKKQGLDPRKDDIVMKFIKNPEKTTKAELEAKQEKNEQYDKEQAERAVLEAKEKEKAEKLTEK